MTQGIQTTPFNVDELRERLQKMSDVELRKFGQATQHMGSPKETPGQPPQEVFAIQLDEARKRMGRKEKAGKTTNQTKYK